MQQRKKGKQFMYIGGVLVALVLGAAFFMTRGGGSSSSAATGGGTGVAKEITGSSTPVVVAVQAIPQGTTLNSAQGLGQYFAVKELPRSIKPTGAYSSVAQIGSLARSSQGSLTTTQTIYRNTPVVSGMFSPLGLFRQAASPAFSIPYGYVAIAVNFDAVNSVLGSINAGDLIDMMASYKPGTSVGGSTNSAPPKNAPGQTQYVLNGLRVLSVNGPGPAPGNTGSTNSSSSSSSSSSAAGSTASAAATAGGSLLLLARYQQALEIQHLKDFGWQMSAVLPSAKQSDSQTVKTTPVTDRWFFVKTNTPFRASPGY